MHTVARSKPPVHCLIASARASNLRLYTVHETTTANRRWDRSRGLKRGSVAQSMSRSMADPSRTKSVTEEMSESTTAQAEPNG
ncbi:hypothetical protein BDZ89DRAFT_1068096 [Hymenopellis radicata]|nr:hypothetical protein BDZ89DRAFT_1068096 [Hymenopellis radicata]